MISHVKAEGVSVTMTGSSAVFEDVVRTEALGSSGVSRRAICAISLYLSFPLGKGVRTALREEYTKLDSSDFLRANRSELFRAN